MSFRWPPPSSMHRCTRGKKLRITAWSVSRAMLSGVRTEDGRPRGFVHVTEPSSRHCRTHRRIAFGDGASCWFCSWRNPRLVSVIDPVRINSSTAHTCWPNLQVTACVQIPALRDTLAEKHVTKILKCFTISAAPCTTAGHQGDRSDYCICTVHVIRSLNCQYQHMHNFSVTR